MPQNICFSSRQLQLAPIWRRKKSIKAAFGIREMELESQFANHSPFS